jgi:hypothetical protein
MSEKWQLSGTYFEACNCDAACPCVFLSPPTEGDCRVLIAWHIDRGSFGEATLDGLNASLFVHSPGNMVEGKWKAALYLDETATEAQKEGLTQILSGQAGGHPAVLASFIEEVLGVHSARIEYRAEGKRRSIRIPNVGEAEIEAVPGQGEADITVNNHPLAVAPGQTVVLAKSKSAHYSDHGIQLEVSGKNGFYSPFVYEGP